MEGVWIFSESTRRFLGGIRACDMTTCGSVLLMNLKQLVTSFI